MLFEILYHKVWVLDCLR